MTNTRTTELDQGTTTFGEELCRTILEDQTEVIVRFRADGTLMFANEAYCRLFGKRAEELIGKKWQPLAFAVDLPHIEAQLATLSPSNPVVVIENRACAANGELPWFQFVNRVFYDAEGHLVEIQAVGRDITERKLVEERLRASETRFRAIFDHSPVGVLFTIPDGRVLSANPAACAMLGRSEEEICRLGRHGLVDPNTPNLAELLAQRERTGSVNCTLIYIRGDGVRFPADSASVVFDTAEGPRTCTIIQDVSEQEAAAERIRDFSRRLLAIREEEKQRLSAALHHDVGSMTVGVSARMQAAEEDLRAGKPEEALAVLRECRRLFDESVQRLKDLALELRPADLDILGLPVALRQYFTRTSQVAPLRISFTDATHGAKIDPDTETALFRVAQECLNNVIKHADAKRVRVRIEAGKEGIELVVADDGKGFDHELVAGRPGVGMGLRAVREMVRGQGGKFMVHGTPGKGTKIVARFPLRGTNV
jgi:two-component system, NarL family, sensor histidine kinase UhpB